MEDISKRWRTWNHHDSTWCGFSSLFVLGVRGASLQKRVETPGHGGKRRPQGCEATHQAMGKHIGKCRGSVEPVKSLTKKCENLIPLEKRQKLLNKKNEEKFTGAQNWQPKKIRTPASGFSRLFTFGSGTLGELGYVRLLKGFWWFRVGVVYCFPSLSRDNDLSYAPNVWKFKLHVNHSSYMEHIGLSYLVF